MLNPFPIQFLSLFAYFLLRICVGILLLHIGRSHLRSRGESIAIARQLHVPFPSLFVPLFILAELTIGILTFFGAYTQYAMLGLMALSLLGIFSKYLRHVFKLPQRLFYVLLFGTAISLFTTGAGVFAFDLPI